MTGSELRKQLEANVVSIYGSAFVAEIRKLEAQRFVGPLTEEINRPWIPPTDEDLAKQAATYATQVTVRYLDLARKEYPEAFVK